MNCPLCEQKGAQYSNDDFFNCQNCHGIFRNKKNLLSPQEEKTRYEKHNNDINDKSYQKFVSPIVSYVFQNYTKDNRGLDFGSGNGPVISKLLTDKKYTIKQYDPFFDDRPHLLAQTYDYVIACEVIEHFRNPQKEFYQLKNMLHKNGVLICMTELFSEKTDFHDWYYKNDPTHIFFYQKKTIDFIAKHFGFRSFEIDKKLIVFKI